MPDRGKADRVERRVHKASVFEAVATPTLCDDLGLEAFGVEADRATEKNVEAFKWDAGDVRREKPGERVVGGARGPL